MSSNGAPVDLNAPVTNPALKAALDAHTRAPTGRTLARISQELRGAHLLLPFLADEFHAKPGETPGQAVVEAGSQMKFLTASDGAGRPVVPAFTDWDEIRQWTKENVSTLVMGAEEFGGWVSESMKAAAAVFNPAGAAVRLAPDVLRAAIAGKLTPADGFALNGRLSQLADVASLQFGDTGADMNAAQRVGALLAIAPDKRNAAWSEEFFVAAPKAALVARAPKFIVGPDLFRYVNARLAAPNDAAGERFCLASIAAIGMQHGFGVALNATAERADWVFSAGDLLAVQLRGTLKPEEAVPAMPSGLQRETLAQAEQVMFGAPSEAYLPSAARALIAEFMHDALGVEHPALVLMARPTQRPTCQLVFSVHRQDFANETLFTSALHRLSWFVPRHYAVVAVEKSSDLTKHFVPLLSAPETNASKKPWFKFW